MNEKGENAVAIVLYWAWHGDHEAVEAWGTSPAAVEAKYRHLFDVPAEVEVFVGSPVPLPVL